MNNSDMERVRTRLRGSYRGYVPSDAWTDVAIAAITVGLVKHFPPERIPPQLGPTAARPNAPDLAEQLAAAGIYPPGPAPRRSKRPRQELEAAQRQAGVWPQGPRLSLMRRCRHCRRLYSAAYCPAGTCADCAEARRAPREVDHATTTSSPTAVALMHLAARRGELYQCPLPSEREEDLAAEIAAATDRPHEPSFFERQPRNVTVCA